MVRRVLEGGQRPGKVGEALGVSERTVYKWVKRFEAQGEVGLLDRSSRPRRSPRQIAKKQVRAIERLRRRRWTAPRIAEKLGMAVSTVGLWLRRLGLERLKKLDPSEPVVRYERKRPGELIHLDTKKLARIERVGHRIHGDRSKRVYGAGWEFLHVCVDDATRLAYVEVLPDEKGVTVSGFLERASAWLADLGIKVERVMTDNGSGYVSHRFRGVIEALGARHLRTRPYRPQTNGKAERFIQTANREWAYSRPYSSSVARTSALGRFIRHYNRRRRHSAIGNQPPFTRFAELA
jgi:transposase InsO family protein